jgi:hypothetical protein
MKAKVKPPTLTMLNIRREFGNTTNSHTFFGGYSVLGALYLFMKKYHKDKLGKPRLNDVNFPDLRSGVLLLKHANPSLSKTMATNFVWLIIEANNNDLFEMAWALLEKALYCRNN